MFQKKGETLTNGDFTILLEKQIGKGAYGIVYECEMRNSNDSICAKIIRSNSNNSDYLKRESEIINILRISNPINQNLVKVHYCEYQKIEGNDVLIVIMEKCITNLKDDYFKKTKYPPDEVLNILKQLLNGYKPLYEKSILHRDIKPENILISYDNQNKPIYKLADFGIGKINQNNDTTMTKVGTPVYAAPELNTFINDDSLDQAMKQLKGINNGKSVVDVFSIGIMLYQFIFGKLPFETSFPEQVKRFLENLKNTPFKITEPIQNINLEFLQLIEKMIVYNPKNRITFSEIFSHKLISMITEQPQKLINPLRSTTNPGFPPKNTNQNFIPPNQNQNFTPPYQPQNFTNPNQNPNQNFTPPNQIQNFTPLNQNQSQNLRSTNTINNNSNSNPQFTPNFANNQNMNIQTNNNQFRQTVTGARMTSYPNAINSDNMVNIQAKVIPPQQNNIIQIDEINDTQSYLKTSLSENSQFYCKQTESLLHSALLAIEKQDKIKINFCSQNLIKCYEFTENGTYSLGFLKYYYCLLITKNNLIKKPFFNNAEELKSEIIEIIKKNTTQKE